MKKNKIFPIILVALAVLLLTFGISYAFLINRSDLSNSFYAANNEIVIEEELSAPKTLVPGSVITKTPKIHNTGTVPVCVRARVLFSDNKAEDFCDPLVINNKWTLADGWYYYQDVVGVDSITQAIFNQVKIANSTLANEITDFQIIIYVESVTSDGISCIIPNDEN